MKKIILIAVTLLALIIQSLAPAFATSEKESIIPNNVSSQKIGTSTGVVIQPMGIKSWIAKKAMQAIAYALRYSISGVSSFLRSIGASTAVINEINNKALPLASTLERIAIYFDYYSATTKNIIIQQLQAQGFSYSVSYWVAQVADFVAF